MFRLSPDGITSIALNGRDQPERGTDMPGGISGQFGAAIILSLQ